MKMNLYGYTYPDDKKYSSRKAEKQVKTGVQTRTRRAEIDMHEDGSLWFTVEDENRNILFSGRMEADDTTFRIQARGANEQEKL